MASVSIENFTPAIVWVQKRTLRCLQGVMFCVLIVLLTACGSSDDGEERRSIHSTSARPEAPKVTRKIVKTSWDEPKKEIVRNPLQLRRGGVAHLEVTAATFDSARLVAAFREELVEALQETDLFTQVNVSGNQGHYALDVIIFDTRVEDGFLFFSGPTRLKIGVTITDTTTKRRLSPEDPDNLFYGSQSDVVVLITTYLSS